MTKLEEEFYLTQIKAMKRIAVALEQILATLNSLESAYRYSTGQN